MIDQRFVGVWSTPVLNVVEKGAVRKFADAIGDPNPIYRDEAYAATTRFGRIVAPPTFSRTFDYGALPGCELEQDGLIHGEQTFHYHRPLFVGDELLCSFRLADMSFRTSADGKMVFLIYEQRGVTKVGEEVFTERMTVISREEVKS